MSLLFVFPILTFSSAGAADPVLRDVIGPDSDPAFDGNEGPVCMAMERVDDGGGLVEWNGKDMQGSPLPPGVYFGGCRWLVPF